MLDFSGMTTGQDFILFFYAELETYVEIPSDVIMTDAISSGHSQMLQFMCNLMF
jgi:hypothetical protein